MPQAAAEQEELIFLLIHYSRTAHHQRHTPHNYRTPIESSISAYLSSTSHYAPNANQLLTNYSFITHSLAFLMACDRATCALRAGFRFDLHGMIVSEIIRGFRYSDLFARQASSHRPQVWQVTVNYYPSSTLARMERSHLSPPLETKSHRGDSATLRHY